MRLSKRIGFTFFAVLLGLIFMASPATAQDCEFDNWDVNNDSFLGEDEFFDAAFEVGYYDSWDEDDNDSLSEIEWEMAADEHLSVYDFGTFNDWDTNSDSTVTEQELHEGLFELIDRDSDGQIGEDDWSIFDDDNGVFC